MCNSKDKSSHGALGPSSVAQIDGRPVLQPAGNRVATADAGRPLNKKKSLRKSLSLPSTFGNTNSAAAAASDLQLDADYDACSLVINFRKLLIPASPEPVDDDSNHKPTMLGLAAKPGIPAARNKSNKSSGSRQPMLHVETTLLFSGDRAEQREQACLAHAQRRTRIVRYGRRRTVSDLGGKVVPLLDSSNNSNDTTVVNSPDRKRCSFITPNSDPLYVAYHDEEWGVPVHDDRRLFELLVLTGAQVGSDWTTILKKRNEFRAAFGGFDAEVVGRFTERQMASVSTEYALDLGRVRGIVDNANRILQVQRDLGSLDRYLWGFVNHRPLNPSYKFSRKIPVKTSKSESISKDLIRRGFRFVGPTVVHSFMQAAGLTNDHLISCPRHLHCSSSSSSSAAAAAAAS